LAHVPEGRRLFRGLNVKDNLLLGAYLRRDDAEIRRDLDYVFSLFTILRERQRQDALTLSGGEQQMCAIGRGIMSRPKLLMIHELSLGLAPRLVDRLSEALLEINRTGATILIVESDHPDELLRLREPVDTRIDMTAIVFELERAGRSPVIIFEKPGTNAMKVVTNVAANRKLLAVCLGVEPENLPTAFRERCQQ